MFVSIAHPQIRPMGAHAIATPGSPRVEEQSPRALHARLLANAAARRLRAAERAAAHRDDDADYWLHAAPVAVRRACALREDKSFAPLP